MSPHIVRKKSARSPGHGVQPVRDSVQIVVEQVGVPVEGARRRDVPEHPLDGLHVRPSIDAERDCRVPQLMRGSVPGSPIAAAASSNQSRRALPLRSSARSSRALRAPVAERLIN